MVALEPILAPKDLLHTKPLQRKRDRIFLISFYIKCKTSKKRSRGNIKERSNNHEYFHSPGGTKSRFTRSILHVNAIFNVLCIPYLNHTLNPGSVKLRQLSGIGRSSDLLHFRTSFPFLPEQCNELMSKAFWSLQQRDCPGFSPDSLLIAVP